MPPSSQVMRRIRAACVVVGMLAGLFLPFIWRDIPGPVASPAEVGLGYRALAVAVHASYGALGGWAIGALLRRLLGDR